MRIFGLYLLLVCLCGCAQIDVRAMKAREEQHMKNSNQKVKAGTGVDLGTETPKGGKKKYRLPTAPVDQM